MRDRPRSTRHTLRAAAVIVAAGVGLAALYSCSLIVDTQSQQCQSDGDCAQFTGGTCDTAMGVCVSGTTSSGTGTTTSSGTASTSSSGGQGCNVDGGIDGGGCYDDGLAMCPATTNAQLLNACATGCIPFDDSTVKGLLPNGSLPPLPPPPDGGL